MTDSCSSSNDSLLSLRTIRKVPLGWPSSREDGKVLARKRRGAGGAR